MKKKALIFAQQIHEPWIEGVKNNSMQIAKCLKKKMHIEFISHKGPHNNKKYDSIEGISVFYLLTLSDNILVQLISYFSWAFKSLIHIYKYKPDVIFVQYLDTSYLLSLLCIKICFPSIPIVLTIYSTDELNIWYKKIFLKYFSFKKVIIISEFLRNSLIQLWYKQQDIIYIPLSYDASRYLKYPSEEKILEKTILFSAGPMKDAGSFFMVDLAEIMPDYKFIFTLRSFNKKSENDVEELQEYINKKWVKNIEIRRNIDNMEVLLSQIDIYVLPLQEMYIKMLIPVALLEAMARWNTCFVSDLDNLKMLLQDEENAIIFSRNNVFELKEKIEIYRASIKIKENAYKFMKDYPTFEDIAEKYYKLV